jgi:hypothetical protein
MSWREHAAAIIRRASPVKLQGTPSNAQSLLYDLRMTSRHLMEVLREVDARAGTWTSLEEWLAKEMAGGRAEFGSLVEWLDIHYPLQGR